MILQIILDAICHSGVTQADFGASAIIGVIAAAIAAASTVAGAATSAAAKKKQKRLIDGQLKEVDEESAKGYMQTAEAKEAKEMAQEQAEEQKRIATNRSAMTGATHEAQIAAQSAINKDFGNTVRGIAAQSTAWKENQKQRRDAILNKESAMHLQSQKEGAAMVQSGINGLVSSAGAIAGGDSAAQKQFK